MLGPSKRSAVAGLDSFVFDPDSDFDWSFLCGWRGDCRGLGCGLGLGLKRGSKNHHNELFITDKKLNREVLPGFISSLALLALRLHLSRHIWQGHGAE